jgi:TRAP-type C4-dicarboxylate transport system substrate-binding protein
MTTGYLLPRFIERVYKMSGGRLVIDMYYAGELVAPGDVADALRAGTIEIANLGLTLFRGAIPVGWLCPNSLPPLVWTTHEHFLELYHRGWGDNPPIDELMRQGAAEAGIHLLNHHAVGNTYFWSTRPLHSVDDLKGFKVRFFGAMSDTMEAFGGSPVWLPHPETYLAMALGTLDGSGTAWWIYRDLKLYEVAPYFIGPAWQTPQAMANLVSLEAWEALCDELRAIVDTADRALALEYHQRVTVEQSYMFDVLFPKWGTTYIEWGPECVARIREVGLKLMEEIVREQGPKDPRVVQGIEIVKEFMRDRGYIE